MIEITALKWVPPIVHGLVRDLRVRWLLKEAGLPYRVRRLGPEDQASAEYRTWQPFGQVPAFEEDGLRLFESGAIALHVAERSEALLPREPAERARVICWLFASLNSIEPPLAMLADIDFSSQAPEDKAKQRPRYLGWIQQRYGELETVLGEREWLTGPFSVADLMMTTVLRIGHHAHLLEGFPRLAAYRARGEARPAFQRALAEQLADYDPAPPRPAR